MNSFGEPETLAIGATAPDFSLPGVDGKTYTLGDFRNSEILVIIFTANHCPTAQAYEDRIKDLADAYPADKVQVVAISPNSTDALCLEELGYSDLGDSFEEMKIRAADKAFNFPYLYDGDKQETALAYGPIATPHVFIFDSERHLRFTGRIDDMEDPYKEPTHQDTRNAIEALLKGEPVPVEKTKVFGCSIKWASKSEWKKKLDNDWKNRPVELDTLDDSGLRTILSNSSDNYRLVNIWATWCGPCIIEFPEFVVIQRMYGNRNFECISISVDKPAKKDNTLKFLKEKQAAFSNYIYNSDDSYAFIQAVDSDWYGSIPYTMLIAPGGEVVYRHTGIIDHLEVNKVIISKLGRYYADDK